MVLSSHSSSAITFRVSTWGLVLILLLSLSACRSEEPIPDEAANQAVGEMPPSLRAEQAPLVQQIRLDEQQVAELQIQTVTVGQTQAQYPISLPGEVLPAPEHYALVSAPISGRVVRIYAHEGEAVRQGQVLLELESLEFASLAAEYLQAQAEQVYQQTQVQRLQTLVERKISPRSALDKAEADLSRAQASVSATYARLKALGLSDTVIEAWSGTERSRPLLPITAPISGIIDRHEIDMGQAVMAYDEMLSLIDPSRVLVRGFVSPDDAPYVRPGDPVEIGLGRDSAMVRATVTTISPALDVANKSVVVNILTDAPDRWPIPGQSVGLRILSGTARPVMTLPLAAVQYEGEQATVFVQTSPQSYEKRPITIDRISEDEVVVAEGLRPGERVAVTQIFSLKALGRFEQYAEE